MATLFKVNVPVTTAANFVDVQNNLAAGTTHTFQLVVVDEQGNRSDAKTAKIVIKGTVVPPGPVGPGPVVPGPTPSPGPTG